MTPPAATAAGRALPRPAAPRRARRVSGPARPQTRSRTTGRAAAADPFALRAVARVVTLADSRLLRRLVHGRLWIPLVAAGLMGIVFMQVSMLKLNAGIGRAVQSASTLERQNAAMRADVSRMESGERIDEVAQGLGMVVPADGGERYVSARGTGLAARATERMTAPGADAIARTQAAAATQAANAVAATQAANAAAASTTPASLPATTPTTTTQSGQVTPPPAAQQQAAPPTTTTAAPAQTTAQTPAQAPAQAAAAPSGGVAAPAANGQG
jgi:hypothetical protein